MEYSYISLMEPTPETVNDVPESIYRITDDANGGVFEPRWKEGNRIEYVKISYGIS